MYKLAFVVPSGTTSRLWMCDKENGARTITIQSRDVEEIIAALLGEDWEPFGIGTEGSVWFRKANAQTATVWPSEHQAND